MREHSAHGGKSQKASLLDYWLQPPCASFERSLSYPVNPVNPVRIVCVGLPAVPVAGLPAEASAQAGLPAP